MSQLDLSSLIATRKANAAAAALNTAARSYHAQCVDRQKRIEAEFRIGKITKWADLNIPNIPAAITCQPLSFATLKSFLISWTLSAEARFKLEEETRRAEVSVVSTKFVKAETSTGLKEVGIFTLKPRQRKAIDAAVEKLRDKTTNAVVIPLEGGEGKSVIGWALIKHWQQNKFFGHPIAGLMLNQGVFDTKAAVVINMNRRGRACGVANLDHSIVVVSHSQWSTKQWRHFFREETIDRFGTKVKRLKYILPPPAIMIIDECQDYKKPTSLKSKYLHAMVEAGVAAGSVFVFMSATPWVTINDTWLFSIATGRTHNGDRITLDNFPSFAKAIASRAGCSPSDNDPKAMLEFRKEFNDCHIIPPRDPREFKAYNDVMLVEFKNDADRAYYARTMQRYYEELERCGKGDTEVNKMTAFLKLRHSEERLKVPYFVDLMLESHAKGFAPICGVCSQDSIKEMTRLLVNRGVPRNKISVVWGGDKIITKQHITAALGEDMMNRIGMLVIRYFNERDTLDKLEVQAVRRYLRWAKEQVRYEETDETQAIRHEELMKLGLDRQTLDQRQDEIDRFQNGTTEFCLFTLSAGGTGVDLDQQIDGVRPREGFFTICYWAEEFMQALYRAMRIATKSNVHQHMVFFKDTIVADHVAPRLDAKIKSIRAGIASGTELADETIDLLSSKAAAKRVTKADLRDGTDTEDDLDFDVEAELNKLQEDDDEDPKV